MLRRIPAQGRAERTIEKIFEATTQLIEEGDETTLSTNKIAAKAGISVGTLYQYFRTKEAIFSALVDHDRKSLMQQLTQVLSKTEEPFCDPVELLAEFIHVLVQTLASGQKLQQSIVRSGWLMDQQNEMTDAILDMTDAIGEVVNRMSTQSRADGQTGVSGLKPVGVFLVSRALIGVLRSASLERSHLLGSPELEAELLRLARILTTQR